LNLGSTIRFIVLAALLVLLTSLRAAEDKRIAVYGPQTFYSLNVVDRHGAEYVGLLEILEPLGAASAKQDGDKVKLRFNDIEGQFTDGKTKVRLRGKDLELTTKFLIENGRGLLPLRSLTAVLRPLLGTVEFHEAGRRLFLGGAVVTFAGDLMKTPASRLVLSFSAPVNPHIATEPGKLRMVFTREPLMPPRAASIKFEDTTITSASFGEHNGAAEVTITGTAPLLASFADGGRTIIVSASPQPAQQVAQPPAAPAEPPPAAAPPPQPAPPRFTIVVDAAHGGDDRGATLSDQLAEKDATLAFARRLRTELANRGVAAILLRDSDANFTHHQRSVAANAANVPLYVSLHASTSTSGVHVYTAMLSPVARKPGTFLPWDEAQTGYVESSRAFALALAAELEKRNIAAFALPASVRPLNNIAATAVAVEVGPPFREKEGFASAVYQQAVCAAISSAVSSLRATLEAAR
jgi:N-acetylmuramoyl-L-alanine amidase